MIRGNAVGETMFYGRGAGKLPTASAVVGDVVDCILHRRSAAPSIGKQAAARKLYPLKAWNCGGLVRTEAAAGAVAAALGPVEAVPARTALM